MFRALLIGAMQCHSLPKVEAAHTGSVDAVQRSTEAMRRAATLGSRVRQARGPSSRDRELDPEESVFLLKHRGVDRSGPKLTSDMDLVLKMG